MWLSATKDKIPDVVHHWRLLAGLAETQEVQQVLEELLPKQCLLLRAWGPGERHRVAGRMLDTCGWGSGCVGSMGARRGTPVAEVTVTRDTSSSTALCVLTRAVQGISPRLVRLYRHSSTVIRVQAVTVQLSFRNLCFDHGLIFFF